MATDEGKTRKEKSWGARMLGTFVETGDDAGVQGDDDPSSDLDALGAATDVALDATGGGGEAPKPRPDIRDVAFSDVYAQTCGQDDGNADKLLAAATKLNSKSAEVQQAALEATAEAIGADTAAVTKTLAARLKALGALVTTTRKIGSEAQTSRTAALQVANVADEQHITALRAEIAAIETAIKERNAAGKQADLAEANKQLQFEQRVKAENDRLAALAKLIAPSSETVK